MATRRKTWAYNSHKHKKKTTKVPEEMKQYLQEKGDDIVEKIFKPKYLKPIPDEQVLNHIIDIYTKWYRNYFYFCVKYQCPPNPNPSFFENKFVRLEYIDDDKFQYSFMRHTGQWLPTHTMTIEECLKHVIMEIPH